MVALSELDDPKAVMRAIAEYDRLGEEDFLARYGYGPSKSYWLLHDGKRYASKAILGVAFGYQGREGQPLKAAEFAGGDRTVRRTLARLGFTVEMDDLPLPSFTPPPLKADEADEGSFDPEGIVDAREKVLREIRARRGQKGFRDGLIAAYEGRCAISGCAVTDVLEAAHIVPYRGEVTHHPTNGLLLRADLHTLFDCGFLCIDPATMMVQVAPTIVDPTYRDLHGRRLRAVVDPRLAPSREALRRHRSAAAF